MSDAYEAAAVLHALVTGAEDPLCPHVGLNLAARRAAAVDPTRALRAQ